MPQSHFYIFGLTESICHVFNFLLLKRPCTHIKRIFSSQQSKVNLNVNLLRLNYKILHKNVFLLKIYFSRSYSAGSIYFLLWKHIKMTCGTATKSLKTQMFKQDWKFSHQQAVPSLLPLLSQAFVENTCWEVTLRLNK